MRISDWSSDVCSSDLLGFLVADRDLQRIRWHGVGLPQINSGLADSSIATVLRDMVRPQDHPLLEQALHRLQRDGQSAFDLPLRGQDGSYRWYQIAAHLDAKQPAGRSEEHTSELQSLMRISYAVFCLKKKKTQKENHT